MIHYVALITAHVVASKHSTLFIIYQVYNLSKHSMQIKTLQYLTKSLSVRKLSLCHVNCIDKRYIQQVLLQYNSFIYQVTLLFKVLRHCKLKILHNDYSIKVSIRLENCCSSCSSKGKQILVKSHIKSHRLNYI